MRVQKISQTRELTSRQRHTRPSVRTKLAVGTAVLVAPLLTLGSITTGGVASAAQKGDASVAAQDGRSKDVKDSKDSKDGENAENDVEKGEKGERDEKAPGVVGASGLGDAFFPDAGNGGYDVRHYDLALAWDPATGVLSGTATIEARTTANLKSFNLDFRGFTISALTVNGKDATYARAGQELTITPRKTVKAREDLKVRVTYSGVPETVIDPDGALDGWIPTDDGVIALSEPQGSPSWYPANDYPTDKATLAMAMTVPSGLTVLGNGVPEDPKTKNGLTTYEWRENSPMSTYLSTVAIGNFTVTKSRTASGIPIINGLDPRVAAASQPTIDRIGEILDWEQTILGKYPFESTGAIVDDADFIGYALETQSRPVFTSAADDFTMVHELAHQWYGNSVTLASWPDIWLNEGFATYLEWMWDEREGGLTAAQTADSEYQRIAASSAFWTRPPAALPGPEFLFAAPGYLRGSMTLQALRTDVGDDVFFPLMKRWAQTNRYGNVSTAQFIAFASEAAGRPLNDLFNTWLYVPVKPATSPAPQVAASAATSATARTATAPTVAGASRRAPLAPGDRGRRR